MGGAAAVAKKKLDALLKNVGDTSNPHDNRRGHAAHSRHAAGSIGMPKVPKKLKNYVSPYSQQKPDEK